LFFLLNVFNRLRTLRINKRLYKLLSTTSLFFLSILAGIIGYTQIENYSLIDAFYMTIITIATVGFTEVHPLSPTGRIFTSFFIIFNLGVFALFVSVITSYLFEGELKEIFTNYISEREVRKMKDHVIICGYGRNGIKAAKELQSHGIPFVVIERKAELFQDVVHQDQQIPYIEGNATQDEILKAAGIERARALITTFPSDADSVFVTLSARQLNPNLVIIARANETSSESKLLRAGANRLVRPDIIGGTYMANLVTRPEVVEFLDMISGTGEMKLENFRYKDFKEKFKGKSIRELDVRNQTGATIMGFKQKNQPFSVNPDPNVPISEGDVIILLGTIEEVQVFADFYTHKKIKIK